MSKDWQFYRWLAIGLVASSLAGAFLLAICSLISHSFKFGYLLWNLVLAWLPLLFSTRLYYVVKHKAWSSWEGMALSFIWLVLLPNSFYMISDFIHLQAAPTNDVVYYATAFTSLIFTALILGFISLYQIQHELQKRLTRNSVLFLVGLVLASCSTAIYLGRDLRWNSWDVLANPGGVIFDISDRLVHISSYPAVIETAGSFFLLLSSLYFLVWSGVKVINRQRI